MQLISGIEEWLIWVPGQGYKNIREVKMVKNKYGLIELLKQRRVWAAALSAVAAGLGVFGYWNYVELISLVAGALALHSYVKPKK